MNERKFPRFGRWGVRFLLWVVLPASLLANAYACLLLMLNSRPDLWTRDAEASLTVNGKALRGASAYRSDSWRGDCLIMLEHGAVGYVTLDIDPQRRYLGVASPVLPVGRGRVIVDGQYRFRGAYPTLKYQDGPTSIDADYRQGYGWFEFTPTQGEYRGRRVRVEWSDKTRWP